MAPRSNASRVSKPSKRAPRRNAASIVQKLVGTFEILAESNPSASIAAHVQHLKSLDYVVSALNSETSEARRQPTKVAAIRVSWKKHDLNGDGWDRHLDHEIGEFDRFMWRFLNINVMPIELPSTKAAAMLERSLRVLLRAIDENTLLIFLYSGHGSTNQSKQLELGSGLGQSIQWCPIASQIENAIRGQALVIMDACESGSAAAAFRTFQDSVQPFSSIRDLQQKIVVLAASSWSSNTDAWGPGTLTKRIVSAMSSLLHNGQPLSVVAIYAHVSRAAIWNTMGHPLWLASCNTDNMTIPIDLAPVYQLQHQRLVEEYYEKLLEFQEHYPSGVLVALRRFPFNFDRHGSQCGHGDYLLMGGEDLEAFAVWEAIKNWRARTRLRDDVNVSLRYFNHVLDLDLPLMKQLKAIKSASFAGDQGTDGIYGVGVVVEDPYSVSGGVLKGCLKTSSCKRIDDGKFIYNSCGADGVNSKMLKCDREEGEEEEAGSQVIRRYAVPIHENHPTDAMRMVESQFGRLNGSNVAGIKPDFDFSPVAVIHPIIEPEVVIKQEL